VAPRDGDSITPCRHVCRLWEELLPVDRIGVDDDFFHLGGDSVSAARLATRLTGRLRVRVTLRAVLDHPTLGELADHLRAGRAAARR
jgi:aryl carrier-like protein